MHCAVSKRSSEARFGLILRDAARVAAPQDEGDASHLKPSAFVNAEG